MSLVPMQTSFFDPKQEAEVKRRRRVAQAMMKAGEQPTNTEMVSGMAVKQSPWAALARAVQSGIGSYQEGKADTAEADIAKRRQEMIAQAISQYKDNPESTVSILAQDPSTADSAFSILKDMPRGDGQFTGNSIEAQMANRLLKDPNDQIANMYYTKLVTLPGGGVSAISPQGRGFNPQGVPDGNAAPVTPIQPPSQLPQSGNEQPLFNDLLNTLSGKNTGAAVGLPLGGNTAATNESLPLPNPSQFSQAAQAQVRGANGVTNLIPAQPRTPAGMMVNPETGELESISMNKPMPQAAIDSQNETIQQIQGLRESNLVVDRALEQIENGSLNLGLMNNLGNTARNITGFGNAESANLATFKTGLETMRNSILMLHKGVQTEGDAQRAMNQIVSNINSPEVVKQQLEVLKGLNARAEQIKLFQLQRGVENFGRQMPEIPSMAAAPQNVQPIARRRFNPATGELE